MGWTYPIGNTVNACQRKCRGDRSGRPIHTPQGQLSTVMYKCGKTNMIGPDICVWQSFVGPDIYCTGRPDRSNATSNNQSTTIHTMFNTRSNAFRTIHCPPPCINAGQTIRIGPDAFDKMSNEGLYRGNAYAKGRVSAQRKDSGAFRKIHIDADRGIFLLFGYGRFRGSSLMHKGYTQPRSF